MDFYNVSVNLEKAKKGLNESSISEKNKVIIRSFLTQCIVDGLGNHRILKYLRTLRIIIEKYSDGQDLENIGKEELVEIVYRIQKDNKLADWTKYDYKIALKKLYRYLDKEDLISWIKTSEPRTNIRPEDLHTEEDIMKEIEAADHPRDKAFVAVIYDGGLRIGEMDMKIGDVIFDKYGAVANVNGKTGPRPVRLLFSSTYLAQWLDIHPEKDDPNAALWVNVGSRNRGAPMKYGAMRMLLQRINEKAGLDLKCNPHIFRHSRATDLSKYLSEAAQCQHFGWKQGSNMPRIYNHLTAKDIEPELLRLQGVETEETTQKLKLQSKKCTRCSTENGPTSKFCSRCGLPLDLKTVYEQEDKSTRFVMEFVNLMKEEPKILELMKPLIEEIS